MAAEHLQPMLPEAEVGEGDDGLTADAQHFAHDGLGVFHCL